MTLNLPLVYAFHKENNFLYWSVDNGAFGIASLLGVSGSQLHFYCTNETFLIHWSLHDHTKRPLVSWNFILHDNDVSYFQIPLQHEPFLSQIQVDEVLVSPPTPELLRQKLNLSPSLSSVHFFLNEISGRWKSILFFIVSRWFGVKGSKLFRSFRHWQVNGRLFTMAMTSYKKVRSEDVSSLPL